MKLRDLILQLVGIAVAFMFPTIWHWLMNYLPWWPLDPNTTLSIIIGIAVAVVSWILGLLGIKRLVVRMRACGYIK